MHPAEQDRPRLEAVLLATEASPSYTAAGASGARSPAVPIASIPGDLFVGRAEELQHLTEALRLTAEQHGRMDVLVGEPGVGNYVKRSLM